ncbi:MAG: MFS transporter [Anaerolineales bacterium]
MFGDWRVLLSFDRSVRLFLLAWALVAFGYFGIQGVLLNLYLLRLGFDTAFIGLLISSGQVVWALAALPAGALGRRLGLRTVLMLGSALNALGLGLLLLVEAFPRDLWTGWLLVTWMTTWVGGALLTVNSVPYLMHVSTAEERNHAFAAQGAVIALMGFTGSIMAGLLPGRFSAWLGSPLEQAAPYWYPLWLVPVVHLLCVVVWANARAVRLEDKAEAEGSAPKPIALFIFFGLVVFLQTAGEGSVRAFFNVYLDTALKVPTAQIGAIFGVGQLVPVIAALIIPKLLSLWGAPRVLSFTSLGVCLTILALAAFPHWAPASLGFVGVMSLLAVNAPSRNIFSQEIVPPRWRTITSALATIGVGLGWASSAAAGGYLITRVGFSGLFVISALLALAAAFLLWGYLRVRMPVQI